MVEAGPILEQLHPEVNSGSGRDVQILERNPDHSYILDRRDKTRKVPCCRRDTSGLRAVRDPSGLTRTSVLSIPVKSFRRMCFVGLGSAVAARSAGPRDQPSDRSRPAQLGPPRDAGHRCHVRNRRQRSRPISTRRIAADRPGDMQQPARLGVDTGLADAADRTQQRGGGGDSDNSL